MPKILVVDDDESMRNQMRARLSDAYEVIDTGTPEQALALAMEHKPEAVLLDLMMPKFSGFELCQNLRSLSYTAHIPVFVITGKAGAEAQEHCRHLGATAYFQKPIDFAGLRHRLMTELETHRTERRAHVRVRMRVPLKLAGIDVNGNPFEEFTTTENVSAMGFLCNCAPALKKDTVVEVFLANGSERLVGKARVMRKEVSSDSWQRFGFQFLDKPSGWVLNG